MQPVGGEHVGRVHGCAGDLGLGIDPSAAAGVGIVVLATTRRLDRLVDPVVCAASTEVAGEGVGDLVAARSDVAVLGAPAIDEGRGGGHEAGRAVPALERVVGHEGALGAVEVVAVAQPLHCGHLGVAHRGCRRETAGNGSAVELHRAGAAHPAGADQLGAGEAQLFADHVDGGLVAVD